MTDSYFPFAGSAPGSLATRADWTTMAKHWLKTGVIPGVSNTFEPYGDSSGMQVKVRTGACWLQGHYFAASAETTLSIGAAHASNPRIDRVVARVNWTTNLCQLAIVAGTAAASPSAPSLTRTADVYEISLAQVLVAAAAVTISSGAVTDERSNRDVCGWAVQDTDRSVEILINRTGGSVAEGDVVIHDLSNDGSVVGTTTAGSGVPVYVALDAVGNGVAGRFVMTGYVQKVAVTAATAGQYLTTSTTTKKAVGTSTASSGVFGIAMSNASGGYASAILWGGAARSVAPGAALSLLRTNSGGTAVEFGSAGQIVFPATQNPSADPNTLDDCEKGTWTPSLGGNTTFSTQEGVYTKIGRLVVLHGRIIINTIGTGSLTTISGAPFAANGTPSYQGGSLGYYSGLAISTIFMTVYITSSSIRFAEQPSSDGGVNDQPNLFGNSAQVIFTIPYYV